MAAALALVAQPHAQPAQPVDCHRQHMWSDDYPGHYCEIRVERISRTTEPLGIDARPNGSIEIRGDGGDSIVVTERVEAVANSDSEARAMAAQVRVIRTGNTMYAEGPSSGHHSHWVVSYHVALPTHTDLNLDTENGE
ncbi:MAG TPA: hypothetical protein VNW46_11600, partial [Gemmatimonadaceae bacterium]|nr:hypothetical protein [Gemmatimonadaceae bacterium]